MTEPYAFVPLALAAAGGRIDGLSVRRLVAAGLTLLQRSAPLVRALNGRRGAVLLPPSHHFVVALAACAGRGTLILAEDSSPDEIARHLDDGRVGTVFTLSRFESRVPSHSPRVLLDRCHEQADWKGVDGERAVDLGSHFGLTLEGEESVGGSEDEAVLTILGDGAQGAGTTSLSHRTLLEEGHRVGNAFQFSAIDNTLTTLPLTNRVALVNAFVAPLLAGGAVSGLPQNEMGSALQRIERGDVSVIVGHAELFERMATEMDRRGAAMLAPRLRLCCVGDAPLSPVLRDRWRACTGIDLRGGVSP